MIFSENRYPFFRIMLWLLFRFILTAARQRRDERGEAELPSLTGPARAHAIGQPAKFGRGDSHQVDFHVSEPLPLRRTVLDRSEHGAEEQHKAIRILMVL